MPIIFMIGIKIANQFCVELPKNLYCAEYNLKISSIKKKKSYVCRLEKSNPRPFKLQIKHVLTKSHKEKKRIQQSPFSNREAIFSCYMLRKGKSVFAKGVPVGI